MTTLYTPTTLAFKTGLGCTTGYGASGSLPDMVACSGTLPSSAGLASESFLYSLSATTSLAPLSAVTLTTTWVSAGYTSPPSYPCSTAPEFPVDQEVSHGAPLLSDQGYAYVSDDHSLVTYNPGPDGSGVGTCGWARANPDQAPLISWNAVWLPPNDTGFAGGWYLVGQGDSGPVVLADALTSEPLVTLTLTDASTTYAPYNTISVVETATGARRYDSTQACPSNSSCSSLQHLPERLYALDVTAPVSASAKPTMAAAWHDDFEGPSGVSPVVRSGPTSGACVRPCGDQVYFDGSGPNCHASCSSQQEDPTLFGVKDLGSISDTLFTVDFSTTYGITEGGSCAQPGGGTLYGGMQAAAVLEGPEGGSGDYSVWAHPACDPNLRRFDATSGAPWSGAGASVINIPSLPGLLGYVPGSTMQTVTDTTTTADDVVAFLGINHDPPTKESYVTALDLETGQLLWKLEGPTPLDPTDSPFHGQFPIAETSCGSGCTGYVLIAPTAGAADGSNILGLVLHGPS